MLTGYSSHQFIGYTASARNVFFCNDRRMCISTPKKPHRASTIYPTPSIHSVSPNPTSSAIIRPISIRRRRPRVAVCGGVVGLPRRVHVRVKGRGIAGRAGPAESSADATPFRTLPRRRPAVGRPANRLDRQRPVRPSGRQFGAARSVGQRKKSPSSLTDIRQTPQVCVHTQRATNKHERGDGHKERERVR